MYNMQSGQDEFEIKWTSNIKHMDGFIKAKGRYRAKHYTKGFDNCFLQGQQT